MTSPDLTQWARSLFPNISNPATGNDAADRPGRGSEGSGFVLDREATVRSHAPDTAPDFRYRPVTTSVRRRG